MSGHLVREDRQSTRVEGASTPYIVEVIEVLFKERYEVVARDAVKEHMRYKVTARSKGDATKETSIRSTDRKKNLLGVFDVTIAIAIKVNDGTVLATDSTTTLVQQGTVINQYNNANKVFSLVKGLPLGATTWGTGNIGGSSISTLMKDFRIELTRELKLETGQIKPFTVQEIAIKLRRFFYDDKYLSFRREHSDIPQEDTGFLVAGYSNDGETGEAYEVQIIGGECNAPIVKLPHGATGIVWNGQPEAVVRLVLGFSPQWVTPVMKHFGISEDRVQELVDLIKANSNQTLAFEAMPIQDAIDLAQFLVDLSVNASRFWPGPQTVGGSVEIAAITKHEGFKWVRRKYYYNRDLNPEPLR